MSRHEDYLRAKRVADAINAGAIPIKCSCGVTHFEIPDKMRGIVKQCGNCGKYFDLLGPRRDKDV